MELKRNIGRLFVDKVVFLNCDIQDGKYLLSLFKAKTMMQVASRLMKYAKIMEIPVIVTTQNTKVFGDTCGSIKAHYHDRVKEFDKTSFSMITPEVSDAIGKNNSIVLYGCEAHVCLQQTCLDLLEEGRTVHLCTDGITSKNEGDRFSALRRMENAGAIVTTSESIMFEILKDSKNPKFKECLNVLKEIVEEPFTNF